MVSWWPGDGNANDIQGSNNGTLLGGTTFAPGMVDQAFSFNASLNAGVLIPSSPGLNPTEAITIDAWVKPSSFPNGAPTVVRKDQQDLSVPQYLLAIGDGATAGVAHCNIGGFGTPVGGSVPLNQWSHLACTYDRQTVRLYVNGVEVDSAAATQAIPTASTNLMIGKEDGFTDRNFDGLMDEVEIFSRALSDSEIQAIFDAGSAGKCRTCVPPPASMVSWWPGDENANDIQGNNNGTLQNGATFAAGKVGQAFSFDGVNDFIEVPNSPALNPTNQITVDAWYKPVSFNGSGANPIVDKGYLSHTDPYYQYSLNVTGDQYWHDQAAFNFYIAAGGVLYGAWTGPNFWAPGIWYHIAGTYDGSNVKLYVNGVLVDSAPASGVMTDYGKNLRIGVPSNISRTGVDFLPGLVDEVEIFNRALSASEIQAIANAGSAGKCKATPTPTPTATATATATARYGDKHTNGHSDCDGNSHGHADSNFNTNFNACSFANTYADSDTELRCAGSATHQCRRIKHL